MFSVRNEIMDLKNRQNLTYQFLFDEMTQDSLAGKNEIL